METEGRWHQHSCYACGIVFDHDAGEVCPREEPGVEWYCDACIPGKFTWTPDETGMNEEED
jgi:hypothetical protein